MSGESKELAVLAPSRVGSTVEGKWTLERLIGVGRITAVFAAVNPNGRRVAIKYLHPDLSDQVPIRACFVREAYAANTVGHPGAVTVFDDAYDPEAGALLIMELVEGETLEERVKGQWALLPLETLRITEQILFAVRAAHQQGIVHLAIKPNNVVLPVGGGVKLYEFGMAPVRELAGALGSLPVGSIAPAPERVAPEHASGRWDRVDARSDLWAVGSTMFFMLTGQRVLDVATPGGVKREPLSILQCCPGLEPAVARVVDRALAEQPSERWHDADAMLMAIARARSAIEDPNAGEAVWGHSETPTSPFGRPVPVPVGASEDTVQEATPGEVVDSAPIESSPVFPVGAVAEESSDGARCESGELPDVLLAEARGEVGTLLLESPLRPSGTPGAAPDAGSEPLAAERTPEGKKQDAALPELTAVVASVAQPRARDAEPVPTKVEKAVPEASSADVGAAVSAGAAEVPAGAAEVPGAAELVSAVQAVPSEAEVERREPAGASVAVAVELSSEGGVRPNGKVDGVALPAAGESADGASAEKAGNVVSAAETDDDIDLLAALVGGPGSGTPRSEGEAVLMSEPSLGEGDAPRTTLPSGDVVALGSHVKPAVDPADSVSDGTEPENESPSRVSESERVVWSRIKAAPTVIVQVDDEEEDESAKQRVTTPATARAVEAPMEPPSEGAWRSAAIVLASALVTLLVVTALVRHYAPDRAVIERVRSAPDKLGVQPGTGDNLVARPSQENVGAASRLRGESISIEELPVDSERAAAPRSGVDRDRARRLARARELSLQPDPEESRAEAPAGARASVAADSAAEEEVTLKPEPTERAGAGVAPVPAASAALLPPSGAALVPAAGVRAPADSTAPPAAPPPSSTTPAAPDSEPPAGSSRAPSEPREATPPAASPAPTPQAPPSSPRRAPTAPTAPSTPAR